MSLLSKKRKAMLMLLICAESESNKEDVITKKPRKIWMDEWLKLRETYSHTNLMNFLNENTPEEFKILLGMSNDSFNYLLQLVSPLITKKQTIMRKPVSAKLRLIATLTYLATGKSLEDLKFSTFISPQTLGKIIPETCDAIIKTLQEEFMQFPKDVEEWEEIAHNFDEICQFPNCGGAVDGRHIKIVPPTCNGSSFLNYKGYNSIVLLAMVNANLEFIMAEVACHGKMSDAEVFEKSEFNKKLLNKELNIPDKNACKHQLNFVFVGDEAFPLHPNFLKPFPRKNFTHEKKIFNYRLSRARHVADNAFGILANRFRIFHTAINLSLPKLDKVIMACCMLHNYLRRTARDSYSPETMITTENCESREIVPAYLGDSSIVLDSLQASCHRNCSFETKESREEYLTYFTGLGKESW